MPTWHWKTELAVAFMRAAGREIANLAPTRWRKKLPTAPRSKRLAQAVTHERTQWGGLDTDIHDASGQGDANVLLYLHGGGYGVCSPNTHRALIARITRAAGCKTYAPRYRLAPEPPFPAALEDAQRAYAQLLADGVPQHSLDRRQGGGRCDRQLPALRSRFIGESGDPGAGGDGAAVDQSGIPCRFLAVPLDEHGGLVLAAGRKAGLGDEIGCEK